MSLVLADLDRSQIHDNFRLLIDLQGLTQNEVPDSFIFDKCITFHLNEDNIDEMPSYKDVWSKVLESEYLGILTDFS